MSKSQIKIMFTGIIILVLIFIFIYFKSIEEYFNYEDERIKIKVSRRNNILWLGDNVNVIDKGTLLYPSEDLIISNQNINKNFKFNGFIFKPSNDLRNIDIGFKNLSDNKLNFYFRIFDNKLLSIYEYDKKIDIDFCLIERIEKCNFKTKNYSFNNDDYLGISLFENKIIYFSIKQKDKETYLGNIIHKSFNYINYPLNACIKNNKNENLLIETFWVNNINLEEKNKWSLEVLKVIEDDELPPQESLTLLEEEKENIEEKIFKLDKDKPWIKKIYIIEQFLNRDSKILNLTCITNLNEIEIKFLKDIYINLIIKIDNNLRNLVIPHNKYIFTSKRDYESNLIFKLDISKYSKYLNYDVSCKVELVRSKTIQDKNTISNIVKL